MEQSSTARKRGALAALFFLGILLVTGLLYAPSLDSRFIFDDYYNLYELEQVESRGYQYFIFSGKAGPSGRPLSTLSFALQHDDWPTNPGGFKTVNLLIHLLNGILVFFIVRLLAGYLKVSVGETHFLAALAAGLWLLHPVHINTVLYVVQRMTEISGFFVLAGLLAYLWGRRFYDNQNHRTGLVIMSLAVSLGTILAIMGKENGVLLPLFILATEFTLLNSAERQRDWKIWAWIFLGVPFVIMALYFGWHWDNILAGYEKRTYTMLDRLMTQPAVLFTYLGYLLVPLADSFSFYHDDFPPSTGLLQPLHTLPAIAGLLILFLAALAFRRRYPLPCFAVLWFLAGHALESSFLNLELLFEHRNYLPSFGICFLLAWLAVMAYRKPEARRLTTILVIVLFGYAGSVSAQVLSLWTNPVRQAVEWVENRPGSPRALDGLADVYLKLGEIEQARAVYQGIFRIYPGEIYPYFKDMTIFYCIKKERIPDKEWQVIYEKIANGQHYGNATIAEIDTLTDKLASGDCVRKDIPKIMRAILVLSSNPEYEFARGALHEFLTLLAIEMGDKDVALRNIRRSIEVSPTAHRFVLEMRILMAVEDMDAAESSLEKLKSYLAKNPKEYIANQSVVDKLEVFLRSLREQQVRE